MAETFMDSNLLQEVHVPTIKIIPSILWTAEKIEPFTVPWDIDPTIIICVLIMILFMFMDILANAAAIYNLKSKSKIETLDYITRNTPKLFLGQSSGP